MPFLLKSVPTTPRSQAVNEISPILDYYEINFSLASEKKIQL